LSESFREINERNTEHLIIDLRNNEGGKEVYGSLLLSYLMDQEFPYYDYLDISQKKRFSFSEYASVPLAFKFLKTLFKQTDSGGYEWRGHKNCGLQKPAKNNYQGNVYVLINGGSYSVATEFASVLKSLHRAVFIGEETGGGYYGNTSGFFAIVKLPHSDLELGIPLVGFYSKVQPTQYENRGVFPDYEIRPSVSGVLSKKDEVLDYALKIVKHP
jgi:C-terminal processing protease CtpA/Prc